MTNVFISWAGGSIYPNGQYTLGSVFPLEGGKHYKISATFDYLAQGDTPPANFPGFLYKLALSGINGPQIPGGVLSGGTAWVWMKGSVLGLFTPSTSSNNCQLLLVTDALNLSGTGKIANFACWLEQVELASPPHADL
ncbi:MAG TPA: hypothetical protein VGD98_25580 [Ktedonobacteraceae bacterium]